MQTIKKSNQLAKFRLKSQKSAFVFLKCSTQYSYGRCTGTGTENVGAPINFEVGAPDRDRTEVIFRGPVTGPGPIAWTD